MQNNPIKTIFVCEFITGGGLNHSDLPTDLVEQGTLMRDALLYDLSLLGYQVQTTVDARLPPPTNVMLCREMNTQDDPWRVWSEEMMPVDAVWLIAPETNGYFEKMTAIALEHHKLIIGCGLSAINTFSNKYRTYQLFQQAGIATLPTSLFDDWLNSNAQKQPAISWLAKPNDGAGCEDTVCFPNAESLSQWIIENNKQVSHIVQPFVEGEAASLACVVSQGKAQLLSCNKQLISINDHTLRYEGCIVNGLIDYWEAFEVLANQVALLLPDIVGFIGIDLIVTDAGKQLTVIEVNPRLTTSYIALNKATGINPAALIMHGFTQSSIGEPNIEKNVVKLEMSQYHD